MDFDNMCEMQIAPAAPVEKSRKKRKAITLITKLNAITQHEDGKSVMDMARKTQLPQSTISTILKDKKRITDAVKSSTSVSSRIITKTRDGLVAHMEKLLVMRMEHQIQKNIPLSLAAIQAKARSLFNTLLERTAAPAQHQMFTASRGWFQRFKKRHSFHGVKVSGEAASADAESAVAFKDELHKVIEGEGYLPRCTRVLQEDMQRSEKKRTNKT